MSVFLAMLLIKYIMYDCVCFGFLLSRFSVILTSHPFSITVREGESLQLECSYSFYPGNSFGAIWFQDGEKLLDGTILDSSPIIIASNDSHSILRQEDAALGLNGTAFTCGFKSVRLPGGSLISEPALVLVQRG